MLYLIVGLLFLIILYMAWDETYSMPNRKAFNLLRPLLKLLGAKFLFADIDCFKQFNSQHGYGQANLLVSQSIRHFSLTRMADFAFRYQSGDEFVIAYWSSDGRAVAERLQAAFSKQGMSLTCVLGEPERAGDMSLRMKQSGLRGQIF